MRLQLQFDDGSDASAQPKIECAEDRTRITEANERRLNAAELSQSFGYAYSTSYCATALQHTVGDMNAAAKWLLEHGDEWRSIPKVPLVRRIVLKSPASGAGPTPEFFKSCLMYITHHQLVFALPPQTKPWSNTDKHFVRVYSMSGPAAGSHLSDIDSHSMVHAHSTNAVFDRTNNLIWIGVLHSYVQLLACTNHGPAFLPTWPASALAAANTRDMSSATKRPLYPDTILSLVLPQRDKLRRAFDVALWILAHVDRILKHREITEAEEHPLQELNRRITRYSEAVKLLKDEIKSIDDQLAADKEKEEERTKLMADPELAAIKAEVDECKATYQAINSGRSIADLTAPGGILQNWSAGGGIGALNMAAAGGGGGVNGAPPNQPSLIKRSSKSEKVTAASIAAASAATGGDRALKERARKDKTERLTKFTDALTRVTAQQKSLSDTDRGSQMHSFFAAPVYPYCFELDDALFSHIHDLLATIDLDTLKVAPDQKLQRTSTPVSGGGGGGSLDDTPKSPERKADDQSRLLDYASEVCLRLLREHLLSLSHRSTTAAANASTSLDSKSDAKSVSLSKSGGLRSLLSKIAVEASSDALSQLAANVLVNGMNFFYPAMSERTDLLALLMREARSEPRKYVR